MKVIGIVLVLCLAGAMGQTTMTTMAPTQFDCFQANAAEIGQLGNGCFTMIASLIPQGGPNTTVNPAAIQAFCSSSCAGLLNTYLMENCQSPIVVGVCSMDDEGFCTAKNQSTFGLSIAQAIAVPCLNTNCSDSMCNSAVQSISCCFGSLSIVTEALIGAAARGFSVLPSGCVAPVCNTTVGGASLIIAMPVAVVMSLLLVLVAIL